MENSQEKTQVNSQVAGTAIGNGGARCRGTAPAAPVARNDEEFAEAPFQFCVDEHAKPGDVVPALARLLIDLARRRRERDAGLNMAA